VAKSNAATARNRDEMLLPVRYGDSGKDGVLAKVPGRGLRNQTVVPDPLGALDS
jgi:hypothetical protein